jgi:DNA-binding GntR family transcriptional regulator
VLISELDPRGPIARPTLHDAIVARVRDMVIEGELAPGTRLHEGNLGKMLGVSRTPLREALKFLVSEGLLELSPGRGAVVRQFTAKDVHDSLIVLGSLEGLAGRLACANATDAEIREVQQLHDRMMDMYEKRDRLPYLKRIRYIGNEGPEKWAGAVADHEEIIMALAARDPERLSAILTAHMEKTWERVRNAV